MMCDCDDNTDLEKVSIEHLLVSRIEDYTQNAFLQGLPDVVLKDIALLCPQIKTSRQPIPEKDFRTDKFLIDRYY